MRALTIRVIDWAADAGERITLDRFWWGFLLGGVVMAIIVEV